jgi:hypothetical protein
MLDHTPRRRPHFRLAGISPARETGYIIVLGGLFNNSDQCVFFDPHFHIEILFFPQVDMVRLGGGLYYFPGAVPMGQRPDIAGSILYGLPVNKPGQAAIVYKLPDSLITLFRIFNDSPGYKLIVNLPEGKAVSLFLVFRNYGVYLPYPV